MRKSRSSGIPVWFLFISLASVLLMAKLGGRGLANYDDCFYAQKAKEMLASHRLMTLTFDGQPEFSNPPLQMWLMALSFKLLGISEFAAKLPAALFGILTLALVWSFGRKLRGPWTGFAASFVLLSTFPWARLARRAMVDVPFTFWITLALACFYFALKGRRGLFVAAGAAAGLAVLTKSVLAALPLFAGLLFLFLRKSRREAGPGGGIHPWLGALSFLLLGCSWYLHETWSFGEPFIAAHFGLVFFKRAFVFETGPWWNHFSYIKGILSRDWPWLPFLIWALIRAWPRIRRREDEALFLSLWILVPPLLLTFTRVQVFWYLMPIYPASALLIALELDMALGPARKAKLRKAALGLLAAAAALVALTPIQVEAEREKDLRDLAALVRRLNQEGILLTGYRLPRWGVNPTLLFYADSCVRLIRSDPEEALADLAQTEPRALMMAQESRGSVPGLESKAVVLASSGRYLILANPAARDALQPPQSPR